MSEKSEYFERKIKEHEDAGEKEIGYVYINGFVLGASGYIAFRTGVDGDYFASGLTTAVGSMFGLNIISNVVRARHEYGVAKQYRATMLTPAMLDEILSELPDTTGKIQSADDQSQLEV